MRLLLVLSLSLVLATPLAHAEILRVSKSGDGTDGASWPSAFSTVGEAIEAAAAGDDIWVASGTYNESLSMKGQVSMYGGFAGTESDEEFGLRDWRKNETILDATGLNDRVLVGADQTTLDGFTITNGRREYNLVDDGGSGMSCRSVTVTIRNCFFHRNGGYGPFGMPAPASGGGLFGIVSNLFVEGCVFLNNIGTFGGAVFAKDSQLLTKNCFFNFNSGTALVNLFNESWLINCTFGLNNAEHINGNDILGKATFLNCIVRTEFFGTPDIRNSNFLGFGGMNGNIDEDPHFIDPENGDYRLQAGSPCIDAGTRVEVLTDLDRNPRPVDVVGRGHAGETSYDMGCYEFQLSPADLDANAYVNEWDLILFQKQWHDSE